MLLEIPNLLTADELATLRDIAARTAFVDGRITNPHSKVKNNTQLHDPSAYQKSSQILLHAMHAHEDFMNFATPVFIAPPMMTRYTEGMQYGVHYDAAYLQLGRTTVRSDLSCTVFLSDPESYDGGALTIHLGTRALSFRGAAGSAIFYPSNTLHEVTRVTRGERLVAISFIQCRIADPFHREMIYALGEVAAIEGNKMDFQNLTRLQHVQQSLLRYWGDKP